MTWTYTASSHSSGNRNVLEVDAGTTENDLSGLIGLTGVTHYINENHIDVYEIASDIRVVINGTLYHDPDTEILILHHTNAGLGNSTATTAFALGGTNANPAYYYYGTTRTNATRGTSTNSKSTGLIFTGARISNWHPADACMSGGGNSNFVGRGGVILTGRPCAGSMTFDVIGTTWRGTTSALEWRNPFGNANGSFNGTFDGVAVLLPAFDATFNFANSSIGEVINQGVITYHTLREFDVSENINDYDIGSDGMTNQSHREYEIINSATGSDVVKMWRNTRGSTGQRGVVVTKKEVSFNFKDASGTAIEGLKLYLEDNPSSFAKNAVFLKSKSTDLTNGYTTSGDSTITRGAVNANGDMVYDYSTSEVYSKTSDASGDISKFEILTSVQIHEYNTNDADAATIYGMHIHNGTWRVSSSDLSGVSYAAWDTSNFGNFYKVDRRSDSNTNADDFTFKFCSYEHSLSSSSQALKGLGELAVNWVLFDDLVITDERATTDTYSVIDTAEKFYNKAKAYLVDNYAGETETLVSRSGTTLDAGDNNIVLDPSAATTFDLTDATFSTFSGVFITAAAGNPASQPVVITANTAGNVTIEIVGNDTDTVATLAAVQGATATGDGASEILASGDSNKITVTGGSNPIITIKCTSFAGNLTSTETITVNSGVTVLGTITDVNNPSGLSSRVFSLSNIILGTTIQIYNETQVTKRGTAESYSPANVYETLITSGTTTSSTLVGDGASTIAQLISAQSLTADPMADTSYVLPSGWTLTTTEVANDNNRVTISGIYDEGIVPNGDFNVGDSVRIRATCAAAAGAFLPFVNTTIANEGGFSLRVDQQADTIYNDNGIDGSASNFDGGTLTITEDYANLQIDVADTDNPGKVTVQEVYAKYAYLITTTSGIEHFFGAITAENPTNFRINTDIIDLKLQNISTSDMILTGARLYRSDFTTVIEKGYLDNDVANGPAGTFSHDTGELVQFIRPQVESAIDLKDVATSTGVNAVKADTEAVKKKTNLIPGLL